MTRPVPLRPTGAPAIPAAGGGVGAGHARPAPCRGLALIVVLLLVLVSMVVGLLAATQSRTELQIAHNDVLEKRALAVAEAGLHDARERIALHRLLDDELAANTGGACQGVGLGNAGSGLAALGAPATLARDGRCHRFAAFGGAATDGYYVRVEDNHDEPSGADDPLHDRDTRIRIVAHGVVGTAERTVVASMRLAPGWTIFATGQSPADCDPCLDLGGTGTVVDSYVGTPTGSPPACTAPQCTLGTAAVVGANGNVRLAGGSAISGDVVAHGTVSGTVTGTVLTGAPIQGPGAFPPVVACGPPWSSGGGITPAGAYDAATGDLKGSGGASVNLAAGTYCLHSVALTGNSALVVAGPTVVNVVAAWDSAGGVIANTTNDPSNLKINSSCTGAGCVKTSGGSGTFVEINAPAAEVKVTGGGALWGSVVGRAIAVSGGAYVHGNRDTGASGVIGDWREVRN